MWLDHKSLHVLIVCGHECKCVRRMWSARPADRRLLAATHQEVRRLDVPQRVKYKLAKMVYNCLHGKAPSYLTDCCTPISDVASLRHLRSASRRQLLVPRHNLSTYGRRAISVAGPAAWNCLCDELIIIIIIITSLINA